MTRTAKNVTAFRTVTHNDDNTETIEFFHIDGTKTQMVLTYDESAEMYTQYNSSPDAIDLVF